MNAFEPDELSDFATAPPQSQFRPLLILRDVAIVWAITFAAGLVIGIIAGIQRFDPAELLIAIALANLVFGTAAFTLVGCIAPPGRWRHLFYVSLFTWLSSAVNIVLLGAKVEQWLISYVAVLIMMGIGGAISLVLKKEPTEEIRPQSAFHDRPITPNECPMCGARVTSGAVRCSECGEVFSY